MSTTHRNRVWAVTGGAGFIGSHLVDALIERGDEVHVLDDLSSGDPEQVNERATLHRVDISERSAVLAARESFGRVDGWFHLAAQADVRVSVADPVFDATVNVIGTLEVLRAAQLDSAPVVFTSTGGAMYGESEVVPTPETTEARPEAPYGASKLAAEGFLLQDARLTGNRHLILRLANVYGPRQDPHGEAGVVAIFCGRVRDGRPATIFGDGAQTRDYVYVADVVETALAGMAHAREGDLDSTSPIFNVGTGREVSVKTLWDQICETTGAELGYDLQEARAGELQRSALHAGRAAKVLDLAQPISLEDGLRRTVGWFGLGPDRVS